MEAMRLSELQTKKIISVLSGKNIGTIIDVDVDSSGNIENLIIEQNKSSLFSFNREGDIKVAWSEITKIGEDVILVRKN